MAHNASPWSSKMFMLSPVTLRKCCRLWLNPYLGCMLCLCETGSGGQNWFWRPPGESRPWTDSKNFYQSRNSPPPTVGSGLTLQPQDQHRRRAWGEGRVVDPESWPLQTSGEFFWQLPRWLGTLKAYPSYWMEEEKKNRKKYVKTYLIEMCITIKFFCDVKDGLDLFILWILIKS